MRRAYITSHAIINTIHFLVPKQKARTSAERCTAKICYTGTKAEFDIHCETRACWWTSGEHRGQIYRPLYGFTTQET